MNLRTLTVFFWGCLIASAAAAGDHRKAEIVIAIDDEAAGEQVLRFDGDAADLQDLEVGETRSLTDTNGSKVEVSRTEQGLVFTVNGETIEMPPMAQKRHVRVDIETDDGARVAEHREVRVIKGSGADAVTIISPQALDEATRERIRAALRDAGKGDEVVFIDGMPAGGDGKHREVIVIKKKLDAPD